MYKVLEQTVESEIKPAFSSSWLHLKTSILDGKSGYQVDKEMD